MLIQKKVPYRKAPIKSIIIYIIYYICFIVIIKWAYDKKCYFVSFLVLGAALIILMGILYSVIPNKKRDFLFNIDQMKSADLYFSYTKNYFLGKKYVESNVTQYKDAVFSVWINGDSQRVLVVTISKQDYILDEDLCSPFPDNGDKVCLFTNTYYHGSFDIEIVVNRKNIWKICKTILRNM